MHKFTLLTATYNREKTIRRLYESLQKQTFKDFLWLIIDDGSTDQTSTIINSFILEGLIDIEYHYKENGGKHTTFLYATKFLQSDFVIIMDDDDELVSNCLEVFANEWKNIEEEGKTKIGSIRALCKDLNGNICGNYDPQTDVGSLDSNYLEMNWARGKHMENITCWRTDVFTLPGLFNDEGKWLYDKVKAVYESVYWNRTARLYDTRYIYVPLRIYHTESENSLTNSVFNRQKCYNYVFTNYVLLNEQKEYNVKNPYLLLKTLGQYWSCAFALHLPFLKTFTTLNSFLLRLFSVFLFLPAIVVAIKLRKDF